MIDLELRDTGGDGPPVVFLHGLLVDGSLWNGVVERLPDHRCLVPTLPLGSHTRPVEDRSVLTPAGLADLVADGIARLGLDGVTLVGNDTGGAIAQLLVTRRPERIGRLLLTPCDCFETFPPAAFVPLTKLAFVPGALTAALQPLRLPPARRLPIAYGWLSRRVDDATLERWVRPFLADRAVRRDTVHFLRHVDPKLTLDAAARLPAFDRPAVVAWAPEDRFFKMDLGRRLARVLPNARLVEVTDSLAFVPIDRPDAVAELVRELGTR